MVDEITKNNPESLFFIGNGSENFKEKILNKFPNCNLADDNSLDSYSLGIAGYAKFKANDFEDALPMYLRKPQAQRQLEEKLASMDIEFREMTIDDLNLIENN